MTISTTFDDQDHEICVQIQDAKAEKRNKSDILYQITDKPPTLLSILLGFQQYITMCGGAMAYPYIVSNLICMSPEDVNRSYLMQTVFFTSGLATLVQIIYGTRLPLIQGASFGFLIPFLAMADLPENRCPEPQVLANMTTTEYNDLWTGRMRVIQGSILLGSVIEMLVGIFGLMGAMLKFISPVIIGPTIIQLGLSLSQVAMKESATNWKFSLGTIALLVVFSFCLENVYVPFPNLIKRFQREPSKNLRRPLQKSTVKIHLFKLFPVLLTVITIWFISFVCTQFDWIDTHDAARTDGDKLKLIHSSPFFRIPIPFQWGWPSISTSAVVGVLCAAVISMFESVGNYFACAKLCKVPAPPKQVINRGVLTEGIGIFGTGGGVTSYSENIGAIAITQVVSRHVIVMAAVFMLLVSFFVKLSALLATVPSPIIGGILAILSGIITAVGISIIKFVNLDNSRNLFIVGVSTFCGISFPAWFKDHPKQIDFGNDSVTRFATVLIGNPMLVSGLLAFIMDNTIGGASPEERGMTHWISMDTDEESAANDDQNDCVILDQINNNHLINGEQVKTDIPTDHKQSQLQRIYALPNHCLLLERLASCFPLCLPRSQ